MIYVPSAGVGMQCVSIFNLLLRGVFLLTVLRVSSSFEGVDFIFVYVWPGPISPAPGAFSKAPPSVGTDYRLI